MRRSTIIVVIVFTLGILARALPELGRKANDWKIQSSNRLVFAHFMVCIKNHKRNRVKETKQVNK